jgi:hypothetical protein
MITAIYKKICSVFLITFFLTSLLLCKSQSYSRQNNASQAHLLVGIESQNHPTRQPEFHLRINNNSNSYNSSSYHNRGQSPHIMPISQNEVYEVFQWAHDGNAQCEYLSNAANFADQNFRAYARTLSCYNSFILLVHRKIHSDNSFKKATENVPGFKFSHSLWSKIKSGFHDFINAEADRIKREQETARLQNIQREAKAEEARIAELKRYTLDLSNQSASTSLMRTFEKEHTIIQDNGNQALANRYQQRIEALKTTINSNYKMTDYSKAVKQHPVFTDQYAEVFTYCYGTALDKQLHEELCDTRTSALSITSQHRDNFNVQVIVPIINYYTSLSKVQKEAKHAFTLADFSHRLTQILSHGFALLVHAHGQQLEITQRDLQLEAAAIAKLGSIALKSAKQVVSPEYWKDLAVGTVALNLKIAYELEKIREYDDALALAFVGKTQQWHQKNLELEFDAKAYRNFFDAEMDRIKEMTWEEFAENNLEEGMTFVFGLVGLHAATKFANAVGRTLIIKTADLLASNKLLAEEYLVEVAGLGKLALEAEVETAAELATLAEQSGEKLALDLF